MGPKQKKDAKKEVQLKEDKSGIPKNEVSFQFNFRIQHNNIESHSISFQFVNADNSGLERIDCPLIDQWDIPEQDKPNIVNYQQELGPFRIDENFAQLISEKQIHVYLINVDESRIVEEIPLDLSQILLFESDLKFEYSTDKMRYLPVEDFGLKITFDKPLLTKEMKGYLNPLQIQIIKAHDLPIMNDKIYELCYVKYQFFNGQEVKTQQKVQQNQIQWDHRHVFLAGLMNPIIFQEQIRSKFLKFEVHDRDEHLDMKLREQLPVVDVDAKIKEEEERNKPKEEEIIDPKKKGAKKEAKKDDKKEPVKKEAPKKEAKKDTKKKPAGELKLGDLQRDQGPGEEEFARNNYGVSLFSIQDFLKPNVREFELSMAIVPVKFYQDIESKNIDLNTTSRKNLRGIIESTTYFQCDSQLIVSFSLAVPIGSFKKPEVVIPEVPVEDKTKKVQAVPPGKGVKPPVEEKPKTSELAQRPKTVPKDENKAYYTRSVYLLPYQERELAKQIQDFYYKINMEAAQIDHGGIRALTTKVLTSEEKKNQELDFMGGLQLIDQNFRMFIFEGLADKSMKLMEKMIERTQPNSENFKILRNLEVRFFDRIFTDFNFEIKRIRLREPLTKILGNVDIYIRTKTPENIQNVLTSLYEIRKCESLKQVDQFNYFPNSIDLIQMERKYSDALTSEDIHCEIIEIKKSQRKKVQENQPTTQMTKPTKSENLLGSIELGVQLDNQHQLTQDSQNQIKEQPKSKTFLYDTKLKRDTNHYDLHLTKTDKVLDEFQNTGIYSCQKNNAYEKQMQELRQQIRQDKDHFYTYSLQYLGLSIDPYTEEEVRREELRRKNEQIISDKPFRAIPPTKIEDKRKPSNQLDKARMDELNGEPYHELKRREQEILAAGRGIQKDSSQKSAFNPYIGKIEEFSRPEVIEAEKIKPWEKEKMERERKKQEELETKAKFKGKEFIYTKKQPEEHPSQLDKLHNLREGEAVKKGLLIKKSRIQQAGIQLVRNVQDIPSSIFHKEEYKPPIDPFRRSDDIEKAVSNKGFDYYQNPDILTKTSVTRPLKKNDFEK